ncbi:hypothetical protein Trydic_g14603 [Trypoxylus dichotomus]
MSQRRKTLQGLAQGAILSPVLFSLYTPSFIINLNYTKAYLYIDEMQLYYSFKMCDWEQSIARINSDLSLVYETSLTHSIDLNPTKSQIVFFGKGEACEA